MADALSNNDLRPWQPTPTTLPIEWEACIKDLVQQSQGMLRSPLAYALNVRYNSQGVGDLLRSWGLPWTVVVAGYLREYGKASIPWRQMPEGKLVLQHINESIRYANDIEEENLSPLITPPYTNLGALLIALATYYQALKVRQQQSKGKVPQGKDLFQIESIRRTLLHVTKYLGMWHFKRAIEDITEQLRYPTGFDEDQKRLKDTLECYALRLEEIRQKFQTYYQETVGYPIVVSYIPCGTAGMKRRIQETHAPTTTQKTQLTGFDLVIFNIIVPTIADCYTAFGVLGQLGTIPDRMSDYIAHPKSNGYSHISFGLTLQPDNPALQTIFWLTDASYVCNLQIATQPLHAIMYYGCLYPTCYDLYTNIPLSKKQLTLPQGEQFWHSSEGKVYYTIQEAISITHDKKIIESATEPHNTSRSMIVYDTNRNLIALPLHATALDFAYAIDIYLGERAVEAIINNRKAPLFRELDAGDIVEIRAAQETQAQEYWLTNKYVITVKAKNHLKAIFRQRTHEHGGYHLIHNILDRYHYSLTREQLEEELHGLVTRHNLGKLSSYLERLDSTGEAPWTPEWAAQQIMRRNVEYIDARDVKESHWIPEPLSSTTHIFSPRQLCRVCQPTYPHTPDIVGRIHQKKKVIVVHSADCPRLANHRANQSTRFLPMTWQSPPATFKVAFMLTALDRQGLVHDITKRLLHHQSILLSIEANASTRLKNATIYLTIETYDDSEVLNIWDELYGVKKILDVEIDSSATLPHIYVRLHHLYQQHLTDNPLASSYKESPALSLGNRPVILRNPYDISRPATKNMFFGRVAEMKKLYRELCEGTQGKALVLYGPRRSGKSSLCKNFLERYTTPPCWHTFVSLQGCTRQNEEDILQHIAEALCQSFHEQLHQSAPSWSIYYGNDAQTRFKHLVQWCLAQIPGSRLVLILDEFGGALSSYVQHILEPRFFTYWRELISEIPQLSLLFVLPTRSHGLLTSHIFADAFSFAESLPLVYLDRENAERLLADPLREQHIEMHQKAVAYCINLTGGNPYYLTLIGQQLIFQMNQNSEQQLISEEDIKIAVESIIDAGSMNNFLFYHDELQDNEELHIIEAIVDITSSTGRPTTTLKKIAERLDRPLNEIRPHLERLRNGLILNEHRQERASTTPYYALKIELVQRWLARNRWFFTVQKRRA
jgi:(p)ppGpp synthase/HD superfamily hydrolase